ncbi:MAG: permease-like cell division protein FtsX [Bilifractor sp.]|nr:permease-like cell division protein FtsX [Lachnospiraceae bacterium]MDY2838673.1 permease-like cell division protein FtsX [Bilifractor sp.]
MKIRSIFYNAGQGAKNIVRNKMFSLASIATMSACIFIFGVFFSIVLNFSYILRNVETNVGITVFFNEDVDQAGIDRIGSEISSQTDMVKEMRYVSADEAWESFSAKYFGGNEEAAEGWRNNNDNPLANSAHFEVYPNNIEQQDKLVSYIQGLDGVRQVNQSEQASTTLSTMNRLIATISIIIILVLLVVSAFLINNTVTVGINVRKEEIAIQKLIGATNAFVRLPFILEGILIGLIGAAIPLVIIYFVYNKAVSYILSRFSVLSSFMNGLLPVNSVYRILLPVGLILGVGIALIGSLAAIHKHLKV